MRSERANEVWGIWLQWVLVSLAGLSLGWSFSTGVKCPGISEVAVRSLVGVVIGLVVGLVQLAVSRRQVDRDTWWLLAWAVLIFLTIAVVVTTVYATLIGVSLTGCYLS